MRRLLRCLVLIPAAAVAGACASSAPTPEDNPCALGPAELARVKSNAFDFLEEEWPVLDKKCELISDEVIATDTGKCSIAGRTRQEAGCAKPPHEGFSIVFDRTTLEPEEIHFKTE